MIANGMWRGVRLNTTPMHASPARAVEGGQIVEAAALLAESAHLPVDHDLLQQSRLQWPLLGFTVVAAHGSGDSIVCSEQQPVVLP